MILIFCLFSSYVLSQENDDNFDLKDSVAVILNTYASDKEKVENLEFYRQRNSPKDNTLNKYIPSLIKEITKPYLNNAKIDTSINFFGQRYASACSNLGKYYADVGQIEKAVTEYKRAVKAAKDYQNFQILGIVYYNLGILCINNGNNEQGLHYLELYEKVMEENNIPWNPFAVKATIANVYLSAHQNDTLQPAYFDTMIQKYTDVLLLGKRLIGELDKPSKIAHLKRNMAIMEGNVGLVFSLKKDYAKAIARTKLALAMSNALNFAYGEALNLRLLLVFYTESGEYQKAIRAGLKGLSIAKNNGLLREKMYIGQYLAMAYEKAGSSELAFNHYSQFIEDSDSLNSGGNHKALLQQNLDFEYEKKALADSLKRIAENQKKELAIQQATLQFEVVKKRQLALVFILGIIAISAIILVIALRNVSKAKKIIAQQKKLVETDRQKILDSINYAKKIQSGILPDPKLIREHLPGFFNINLPKDIVGGDFYWYHYEGNVSYLALSDCTGHGVPGAFMSIIGNALLNKFITVMKIQSLSEVLDKMDDEIRDLLSQDGFDSSEDGMDIGLIKIDHLQEKIYFVGARQSLYVFKSEGFIELEGQRRGIGGWVKKRHKLPKFQEKELCLRQVSSVYQWTDGYEDQFQEGTAIKFGRERLVKLMRKHPKESDKKLLIETFNEWKGNGEQVDDVSMVAVNFN